MIGRRRLRYIEDKFDEFLSDVFKEGEKVNVVIKPTSSSLLEATFKDVSEGIRKDFQ